MKCCINDSINQASVSRQIKYQSKKGQNVLWNVNKANITITLSTAAFKNSFYLLALPFSPLLSVPGVPQPKQQIGIQHQDTLSSFQLPFHLKELVNTKVCQGLRLFFTNTAKPFFFRVGWGGMGQGGEGFTMMLRLTSNVQSSCLSLLRARTTGMHHNNPLSFHHYKLSIVKFIYVNFQKYGSGRMKWNQKCIFGKSVLKNFVLLAFRLFVFRGFYFWNLMYL